VFSEFQEITEEEIQGALHVLSPPLPPTTQQPLVEEPPLPHTHPNISGSGSETSTSDGSAADGIIRSTDTYTISNHFSDGDDPTIDLNVNTETSAMMTSNTQATRALCSLLHRTLNNDDVRAAVAASLASDPEVRAALNLSLPPAAEPLLLPSSSTSGHHRGSRRHSRRRGNNNTNSNKGDPLIDLFISLAKSVVGGITTAATVVFEGLAGFGGLVREFTMNIQKVLEGLDGGVDVGGDRQRDDGNNGNNISVEEKEERQQVWYDALIGVTMAVFAVIILRRAGVRLATAATV
jgi:hypothetical protein